MRLLLFRFVSVVASLLLALGLAEVALRVVPAPEGFRSTKLPDVGSFGRYRPNFRNRSAPGAKPDGVFRILVVGDSFAWGGGVHPEDAYPDRLQNRLNDLHTPLRFEVVNWSRPGWGTVEEWQSLKNFFPAMEADLLILGYTLDDPLPDQDLELAVKARLARRQPSRRLSALLHRASRLYRLLWERIENTRQRRAFIAYYEELHFGPLWRSSLEALRQFRDAARAESIPMLVVVFPVFEAQMGPAYPYHRIHGRVRNHLRELGIPLLDLRDAYRRVDVRRLAVTPFTDPHPSELAHRIAADALLRFLLKEDWIPAEPAATEPAA